MNVYAYFDKYSLSNWPLCLSVDSYQDNLNQSSFVMHMCIVGYWGYAFGLISVTMESVVYISCGSIYCHANQE